MEKSWSYLTLLLASLAAPACMITPPPDPKIPGPEIRNMIQDRVTAIIVTDRKNITTWVKRGFPMSLAPGDADGGSATPISSDGYFLTADHVLARVEERPVYIIHDLDGRMTPSPARIVWRSEGGDLALLQIRADTPNYYRFSDPQKGLAAGTLVVHGGIATGPHSEPGRLGTNLSPETWLTRTRKFKIDIPLQPGDSGGPVVDAYGHLLGINTAVEFLIPMETAFFVDSEASRPNIRALERIIELDRARQPPGVAHLD